MLFNFTFVPNIEMTERNRVSGGLNRVSEDDLNLGIDEIFKSVHNTEYNVFVYAEDMGNALRKLTTWVDDETCIFNHPSYDQIVMNMLGECVDPTNNQPVVLNAIAIVN